MPDHAPNLEAGNRFTKTKCPQGSGLMFNLKKHVHPQPVESTIQLVELGRIPSHRVAGLHPGRRV